MKSFDSYPQSPSLAWLALLFFCHRVIHLLLILPVLPNPSLLLCCLLPASPPLPSDLSCNSTASPTYPFTCFSWPQVDCRPGTLSTPISVLQRQLITNRCYSRMTLHGLYNFRRGPFWKDIALSPNKTQVQKHFLEKQTDSKGLYDSNTIPTKTRLWKISVLQ